MNKIKNFIIAVFLILLSFSVSAEESVWDWNPYTQTQINLQNWAIAKYSTATKSVTTGFYNQTEPLYQVIIQEAYYPMYLYIYSNQTKIGYSQPVNTWGLKYKIMCPDGKSTAIKRHIALAKAYWIPNTYLPRSDGSVCGSTTPPVTNKTSLATVQALYPLYQVTRIYPDRDIFKVECLAGACSPYQTWIDTTGQINYLSNLNVIGQHFSIHEYDLNNYVRAPETIADQTAKDDIGILANMYFGGYVTWVFDSTPEYIRWW